MHLFIRVIIATASMLLLLACNTSSDKYTEPPVIAAAELEKYSAGWNAIETAGDTICSDGSPYKFFFRPGLSEKLMVYFQGGGACWDGRTCDPDLEPSYKINLDKVNPAIYDGILAFDKAENPLSDYSVVFVPYCSADVFIGNALANYKTVTTTDHPSHHIKIEHRGYINADAALAWTYAHFYKPESIFVAGSSAGSIPSPYYAMLIADQYSNARVSQLGDGSGGYRVDADDVQPHLTWGTLKRLLKLPELADLDSRPFGFEDLYIAAAQRHPHMQLAQYDTAEDKIQKLFLGFLGLEPSSLFSLILANHAEIRASASNFNTYVAGGDLHTILLRPEFYTYHVDGLRVRDWVTDLVNGKMVGNVQCRRCDRAEVLAMGNVSD